MSSVSDWCKHLSLASSHSSGASRGIGLEIGKILAGQGANVAVAAKTADPNPRLPGTIYSAAEEISKAGEKHGAQGLPIQLDIREADKVQEAIEKTVERFGSLDIVVNNVRSFSGKRVAFVYECFFLFRMIGVRHQHEADRGSHTKEF